MEFDFYKPFYSKKSDKFVPGVKAQPLTKEVFEEITNCEGNRILIDDYRHGVKDAKTKLPAACWVGKTTTGKRRAEDMKPTQFFMVDVDHCENPREAWQQIGENALLMGLALAHVTPSGKGLRLVFRAMRDFPTLIEHMEWANTELGLEKYGDFDTAVKDLSRLSFLPYKDDLLFVSDKLFEGEPAVLPIVTAVAEQPTHSEPSTTTPSEISEEDAQTFAGYTYRGHLVSDIIDKYIEVYGVPDVGERHNFYNQMVKYFRCICDNNPLALNYLLPKFGHTEEETLSQCQSICRQNNVGKLPRDFFLFLCHNGFYDRKTITADDDEEEPAAEKSLVDEMPTLPPVFREYVNSAPRDFKIPCINALMPIMGTLTSYLRSNYPIDGEEHATSFFSIVYAPSGAGKSFVKRIVKNLLSDLYLRDMLCDARDRIYNSVREQKSSNDKGPQNPHVQLRLAEAKISETELLEKQQNNKGHHMFTFAAEIDQWAKGARAAGGNKDDMLRIAWDGGEYGQHYKSANSFKGKVNLYWNILMTGTADQMHKYFRRNTANGLVQRCCFTEIENQRFSDINVWKDLNAKDLEIIERFKRRCDSRCYEAALDYDVDELEAVTDEEFDNVVPWKYEFKPFVYLDMGWVWPTIKKFLSEQLELARLEQNDARDSWRKRSAVRGYRLAMICTQCWEKCGKREQKIICDFVGWWMRCDIEASLKPFADTYNEENGDTTAPTKKMSLYDAMPDTFTWVDLGIMCKKMNVKSRVRNVVCEWKKMGKLEETSRKSYKKV